MIVHNYKKTLIAYKVRIFYKDRYPTTFRSCQTISKALEWCMNHNSQYVSGVEIFDKKSGNRLYYCHNRNELNHVINLLT